MKVIIDFKESGWQRMETEMTEEEYKEFLEQCKLNCDLDQIQRNYNWEYDQLLETYEHMLPIENDNQSTIEIRKEDASNPINYQNA